MSVIALLFLSGINDDDASYLNRDMNRYMISIIVSKVMQMLFDLWALY